MEEVAAVKATFTIIAVVLGVFGGHLKTWETGGKDDARALTLDLRDLPVSNQTQPALPDLFHRREWNTSVSQSQKTCCHGELGADVPRHDGFRVDAELFCKVKGTFQASELGNVAKDGGLVHVHRAVSALDETDNIFVQQTLFVFVGYFTDAGFSPHQFLKGVL